MIKLTFIGTASAKLSLQRFYTSLLFEDDNKNILIDCGEGISRALLRNNLTLDSIDKIIISHTHSDHLSGLAGLLTQFKLSERKTPLEIITHKNNAELIRIFLTSLLLFKERFDFEIKFTEFDYENEFQLTENFYFLARENSHLKKYESYKSSYKINFTSPSFLFFDNAKKIFYSSDVGKVEDLFLFNDKIDLFICEITHINISELLESLRKIKPGKVYLIHIPDEKEDEIKEKIRQSDNEALNCRLAFDGLTINVG